MMLQIKATIAIGLPPSLGSGSDRSAPLLREQAAFFPVFLEELDSLFSVYQISLSFASIHCTDFVHERSPFTPSGDLFFSDICLLDRERFKTHALEELDFKRNRVGDGTTAWPVPSGWAVSA